MDKYESKKLIGQGTYGRVVMATVKDLPYEMTKPMKTGDTVAIKILDEIQPSELDVVSRFNHPNIIKRLDFGYNFPLNDDPGLRMYYAMPKSDYDLNFAINILSFEDKEKIINDLFSGLLFMYEQHLVHLDIKPSNILLFRENYSWVAKYADFGSSQYINNYLETTTNELYVTVQYRPPELFTNGKKKIYFYTDIWSLGLTILHLLYGNSVIKYYDIKLYKELTDEQIGEQIKQVFSPENKETTIRKYLIKVPQDSQDYYFNILNDMIDLDPTKRLSITDIIYKYQIRYNIGTLYKLYQPENPFSLNVTDRTIRTLHYIIDYMTKFDEYRTETFFYGIDLFYRIRNLQQTIEFYKYEHKLLFVSIHIIAIMFNDNIYGMLFDENLGIIYSGPREFLFYMKMIYDVTNGILKGDNYFLKAPKSEKLSLLNIIEDPVEYNKLKEHDWKEHDDHFAVYFKDYVKLHNEDFRHK